MGRKGWSGGLNDWDGEAARETAKRVARAYSTAPHRVSPLVLVRYRIGPSPLRRLSIVRASSSTLLLFTYTSSTHNSLDDSTVYYFK